MASTDFDIDPWLGGLGPELASFDFASWAFYDKRVIPETMNWKILVDTFNEGYHIGFLHRDSLKEVLHGNVTDFEAFGLNHRLTFPRKKLERLKAEPEDSWDLMWNTTLVYSLFPNTLLMVQGDHVELARIFPREERADRAVMELGALCAEGAGDRRRARPLGQEHAARPRCRDRRGFSDRTQYPDRPYLGGADAHGLRPQRAGHDPLSPVDAGCPWACWYGRKAEGRGIDICSATQKERQMMAEHDRSRSRGFDRHRYLEAPSRQCDESRISRKRWRRSFNVWDRTDR